MEEKTFVAWINSYVSKHDIHIAKLEDLADGLALIYLSQELTGEKIPKYNKVPEMRVMKMENLNIVLKFLQMHRVKLYSIGAEAVVDGNKKLLLGMVWQLIHHFRINNIKFTDEKGQKSQSSGEEALLYWSQQATEDYDSVQITDFTSSWQDGLAFCAILDHFFPAEFDFMAYKNDYTPLARLSQAFEFAEAELNVPKLLDPNDLVDDKTVTNAHSVILYVAMLQANIQARLDALRLEQEQNKKISAMSEERSKLEEQLSRSTKAITQTEEERRAAMQRLKEIESRLAETETEKARMMSSLEEEERHRKLLAENLEAEAKDKERLQAILQEEEQARQALEQKVYKSAAEQQELERRLVAHAQERATLAEQLQRGSQEADALRQRLSAEAQERARMSEQLAETERARAELENVRQQLAAQVTQESEEKCRLLQVKTELQQDLNANKQMVEELERAQETMKTQLEEEELRRREYEEASTKLSAELIEMRNQMQNESLTAQQQASLYEDQLAKLEALLQKERDRSTQLHLSRAKVMDDLHLAKSSLKKMSKRMEEYKHSVTKELRMRDKAVLRMEVPRKRSMLSAIGLGGLGSGRKRSPSNMDGVPAIKEGWLDKESGSFSGKFDRRFVRLEGFDIKYYRDPAEKEPRKVISLAESVHINSSGETEFVLISSAYNNRKFLFRAYTNQDRNEWVRYLKEKLGCANYIRHVQALNQDPDERVLNFFSHHSSVHLNLSQLANPLETIAAIGVSLPEHKCLEMISFENSGLTDIEVEQLTIGLASNASVTTVNLKNNSIKADGCKALKNMLAANTTITSLDLSMNQIDNEGATYLSEGLVEHRALSVLNLSENSIGDEGAVALAHALAKHQMSSIQLGSNQIKTVGAKAIARLLEQNSAITSLDLHHNSLLQDGFVELCTAMVQHKALTYLDVGDTGLTDDVADSLAVLFQHNTSLRTINLSGNSLGPALSQVLVHFDNQAVFYSSLTLERKNLRLSAGSAVFEDLEEPEIRIE
eukprot:c5307_g1_i1.p1 GENE.c5307_g1_i1~~c5307_g1_i1.p1  ORF type:complete len:1022 (+),score=272.73 c5307_g1_i1:48-3068(+)